MARSFEDILDRLYYDFTTLAVRISIAIVVFFSIDATLGWIVFAWVVIFMGLHLKIGNYKMARYDVPKSLADTRVTGALADTVTNNSTIKLFARLPFEKEQFGKVTEDWSSKTRASWFFSNHVESVQVLFMVGLNSLILYLAIGMWEAGTLSVGYFILFQTYFIELFSQLWSFERVLRHFYENLADAEEMTEILNLPFEVVDVRGAKKLLAKKGEVNFEKVSFSYTDDEESSVVKNLSFTVKGAERVALIGPSGGGKTTIVKLLLRLFDVIKGRFLLIVRIFQK
jgi:ABC-type multidrug transport system fused ATPase/permease subunit